MVQVSDSKFLALLRDQIRSEYTASQQYTAVAVWLDDQDLPRLAAHFYAQALEERNHAMSMVQYLLDTDVKPIIPGIDDVVNDFETVEDVVRLALRQEQLVTEQITALARTARDEGDYLGEQFMQWFLKEQVEEVATMSALLKVVERSGDRPMDVEEYLVREHSADADDPTAPPAAGGAL